MDMAQYCADLEHIFSVYSDFYPNPDFWIVAFLAIMSHTKTLSIKSDDAMDDMRNVLRAEGLGAIGRALEKKLRRIFLERLEALSLTTTDTNHPLPYMQCFHALKILTISGTTMPWDYMPLKDFIPQRLETLRVLCGRNTFPWGFLGRLKHAILDGNHLNLQRIRLMIDEPCRSFAESTATQYVAPHQSFSLAQLWLTSTLVG